MTSPPEAVQPGLHWIQLCEARIPPGQFQLKSNGKVAWRWFCRRCQQGWQDSGKLATALRHPCGEADLEISTAHHDWAQREACLECTRCRQQTSDYKQEFRLDARCRVPSVQAGGERQPAAEKQLGHMLGVLQAARELGG